MKHTVVKKKKRMILSWHNLKRSAKLEQSQVLMFEFSKDNSVVNRKSEMGWLVARVWTTNLSCIFSSIHSPETEECWKHKSTLGGALKVKTMWFSKVVNDKLL